MEDPPQPPTLPRTHTYLDNNTDNEIDAQTMPPGRAKEKMAYRAGLFDAQNLTTLEGIENALMEFSSVLSEANHAQVLQDLMGKERSILELVLCALDIPISQWILAQYPTSATLLDLETSFHAKLLTRLSSFLLFHISPREDLPTDVRDHQRVVKGAFDALRIMRTLSFEGTPGSGTGSVFGSGYAPQADRDYRDYNEYGDYRDDFNYDHDFDNNYDVEVEEPIQLQWGRAKGKGKGGKSQRAAKQAKKAAASAKKAQVVDAKPFAALEFPVPRTRYEVEAVEYDIVRRLKDVLKFFLERIQTPEVVKFIQQSFVPHERPVLTIGTEVEGDAVQANAKESSEDAEALLAPATVTESAVFPLVQPLKSALYFDSPEGFGKWRILISQAAHRILREHQRTNKTSFDIIVKKIKELSRGHFSKDNQKRLIGKTKAVPIFEAKMTNDLRLVYQVDCVQGFDQESSMQVIRVFGVYTHAQMDHRMWERVASQISRQGPEYRARCIERVHAPGPKGNVYIPAQYPSVLDIVMDEAPSVGEALAEADNKIHNIVTLEKYTSLSKELLDTIEQGLDATFPFELSPQERTIVEYPFSCYVLGRSGTGKTTTMLHKMYLIERLFLMSTEDSKRPRQIFVTKSRVLAKKVAEHFGKYLTSLAGTCVVPSTLTDLSHLRPASKDETLRADDAYGLPSDHIPEKYSQLEDRHFPLFVTFDQLCDMIKADCEDAQKAREIENKLAGRTKASSPKNRSFHRKGRLVTFDRFLGEYWPHFNQTITKKFHPSLVFNEIMGVVLGSEDTIETEKGYLSRSSYEGISHRVQPAFAENRSLLYDTFLSYLAIKEQLEDFDASERTHDLIRNILGSYVSLQRLDHIYVDETQDNLLIDTLLLRLLCGNYNGLFWAGDTAQTISAGSSFRFNDLTAFLHRVECKRLLSSLNHPEDRPVKPKMFHLAVNFRSHAGIVNCAQTVVSLIAKHFPYTIDTLSPERGLANGVKPIFYTNIYPGFVREGHFLGGDRNSNDLIELGADQCILVRNDEAKLELEREIGKIGIIMTLYESKGLEFNDVFLYNFFHDSPMSASQWRIVLSALSEETAIDGVPMFDSLRHAALCSELKCLYVAITRARNNLRIADESMKGEPMRTLWANHDFIRSCDPGDDLVGFAVPSSREEWLVRAKELFDNRQYALASNSFEKGGNLKSAAISHSYYLRETALRTASQQKKGKTDPRAAAFQLAAKAFTSCAADSTDRTAKNLYYCIGAECWNEAGDLVNAAEGYRLGEDYTRACPLLRKAGKFDDLFEIITSFPDMIKPDVLEITQDIVRLYYISRKQFSKIHCLFESIEDEIEYLADRNFDLAQVDLLLLHGRTQEAAELHLAEGRVLEAVDVLLDNKESDPDASQKAASCILAGLWNILSLGASLTPGRIAEAQKYLQKAGRLDDIVLNENEKAEMRMFTIIASRQFDGLLRLGGQFMAAHNIDAALLCWDYGFSSGIPSFASLDLPQMIPILSDVFEYVRILHNIFFGVVGPGTPQIHKVFGAKENIDDSTFVITTGSFAYQHRGRAFSELATDSKSDLEQVAIPKESFLGIICGGIRERLLKLVEEENMLCRQAPAFTICLRFVVFGYCYQSPCPRLHAVPDPDWYQMWVKAHLLQILIYHSIVGIQSSHLVLEQQRFWMKKFFDALHPLHYSLGSISNLVLSPEMSQGIAIVVEWIRSFSFSIGFHPQSMFLTSLMNTVNLAFLLDEKEASSYLARSNFATLRCPPQYLQGHNAQNSIHQYLMSYEVKDDSSILKGVLFIGHVMDAQLRVDIDIFCDYIERICGFLLVSNRYRYARSFHGLILPQSWLRMILSSFDTSPAQTQGAQQLFWSLLQPLERLLSQLYTEPENTHLCFGDRMLSIHKQGPTLRSIYISRVCRILGLLGTNITYFLFQNKVFNIFSGLTKKPEQSLDRLFQGYLNAKDFSDIFRQTKRSMQNSNLDQLVHLLQQNRINRPPRDVAGLKAVVYSSNSEILPQLGGFPFGNPSLPEPPSPLVVDAPVPRPATNNAFAHLTNFEPAADSDDEDVPQNDLPEGEAVADVVLETEIPDDAYVGYSEDHAKSASLIQRTFRKRIERRSMATKQGLEGAIYRISASFHQHLQGRTDLVSRHYKVRLCGPVPALLACMVVMEPLVAAQKKVFSRQLVSKNIRHENLEAAGAGLTRANNVLKEIRKTSKALALGAPMHQAQNIDDLTNSVERILTLFADLQLPIATPPLVTETFYLIYKAVIQKRIVRPTQKKKKRPQLADDDHLGDLQGDDYALENDDKEYARRG